MNTLKKLEPLMWLTCAFIHIVIGRYDLEEGNWFWLLYDCLFFGIAVYFTYISHRELKNERQD